MKFSFYLKVNEKSIIKNITSDSIVAQNIFKIFIISDKNRNEKKHIGIKH